MISRTPPCFACQSRPVAPSGFTLIELLVVISIIAVLAGLALPAVNGAIDTARKARAKNDVTQIAAAVIAYEMEYGKLPATSGSAVNSSILTILSTTNDTVNNPRGIIFLEVSPWKKGKGGTNSSGEFCDPWDETSVYQIALDTDYNNQVTAGVNSTNIIKKVAVWSTNSVTNRQVTSW